MVSHFFPGLVAGAILAGCASAVSGGWKIDATCPKESKLGELSVTATAAMKEVGEGQYEGTIVNSFGQKGALKAQIDGNMLSAVVAWQGSGTTEAVLTYDRQRASFTGTDTEGCALVVKRPS